MSTHERQDFEDETPGLLPGESDVDQVEDWSVPDNELFEEESSEDELKVITTELRHTLSTIGVENMRLASHERLKKMWFDMAMDPDIILDLVLHSTNNKQAALRTPLARPNFSDLEEIVGIVADPNPYQIRSDLIKEIVPNFKKYGYSEENAYLLTQREPSSMSKSYRLFGWLAGQAFMNDFPAKIRKVTSDDGRRPRAAKLFNLATEEIESQLKIHNSAEQKKRYDERLSYERQAYDEIRKTLENALNMCHLVFQE